MKTLIIGLVAAAATMTAAVAVPAAANAQPYRHGYHQGGDRHHGWRGGYHRRHACFIRHHHRVCR